MKELNEKQRKICQEAGIEKPDGIETAIKEKNVKGLNLAINKLKEFVEELNQKKFDEKKQFEKNQEAIKLATILIAELQKITKAIEQREQTKNKLNNDKNKPKSAIEKLLNNLQKNLKGAEITLLPQSQGKVPKNQIVTDKDKLDVTKRIIEVRFKNDNNKENDTVLHVNPTGISVPKKTPINEKSISQTAKTVKAAGMKNVIINVETFPKKDREKLVQKLIDELEKKFEINVVNKSEITKKKEEKQEQKDQKEQENTEKTTLKR
ncbi:MAG: hypothetical protein PVI75_03550 [Gammaproteobacteria bacterium]|jgi:hypothetical protein